MVCFKVRNVVQLDFLTDSTRLSSQDYHYVWSWSYLAVVFKYPCGYLLVLPKQ